MVGWPTVAAFITTFLPGPIPGNYLAGLIQDTLGRQFSPLLGLLGTALLAGLSGRLLWRGYPWMLSYPLPSWDCRVRNRPGAILGFYTCV